VAIHRLKRLAVRRIRAAGNAQHLRLRRTVDVGIEQADVGALGSQRQRQVHGRRTLADAALAGRHGDDVLDAGQQLHAALHRVRHDLLRNGDATFPRPSARTCCVTTWRNRSSYWLFAG
jgi:hypothetical protein